MSPGFHIFKIFKNISLHKKEEDIMLIENLGCLNDGINDTWVSLRAVGHQLCRSSHLPVLGFFNRHCIRELISYIQLGNAVAVLVARALGFELGQSIKANDKARDEVPIGSQALIQLPRNFPMYLLNIMEKESKANGVEI